MCGWGGEGHLGASYSEGYTVTSTHSNNSVQIRDWDYHDFTRPTTCPECGADVYFIRYNGGSVWVDEIGWPWPKHACFDFPKNATYIYSPWSVKASELENPRLGIVSRICPSPSGLDRIVEVNLDNSCRLGLSLAYMPSEDTLLGALVCISRQDSLFLHPTCGEIKIRSIIEIAVPTSTSAWFKCERCNVWVQNIHSVYHNAYCGKQMTKKQKKNKHILHSSQKLKAKTIPPAIPEVKKKSTPSVVINYKHHNASNHSIKPVFHPKHSIVKILPVLPSPSIDRPHPILVAAAACEDGRIKDEIDRIAKDSWQVASSHPLEIRLKVAKQEVLRLIAMLSPSIKRQVENCFTSTKWAPLLAAAPSHQHWIVRDK
jgi:hypothetical protein